MKQQKQTDIFEKHIRTLRNLIDRLENPKERPSFNFSDPSDRKALRTIYLDRVAETIRCRRSHFSVKSFESLLRLQRRYLDKRFASSADFFASESGDLLDRFSDRNPVRDLVSFFGSVPDHAIYYLDFSYRYSLAAAIWILDALNEEGNLAKALTVLWEYSDDADEDFIENRIPENLTDPRFDRKTIACMLYLIEHRNDDLQEKDEGDIWISPATLKRASERHEYPKRDFAYLDTADHTPRIAFDFLIGLIHPVSVRRAADRFEAKIVEYAERYLRCREVLDRIEKSVVEHDVAELRNALKTAERDAVIWKNLQQNVKPVRPFSPVLSMDPAAFSLNSSEPEDGSNDDMDNVMKILRNMEEATSRIDEAVESQTMLSDCLSILGSFAANPCYLEFPPADDYPESLSEILEPLRGFSVGNPFETCFAYLYLLDSGAPSAWVEPAVYAILYTAATLLPWYCDPRLDEVSDPFGTMIRKALFEGGEEKRDWDSGNGSDAESSEETDELSYEETDEPEDEEPPDWNDHFIEFFRKSIFFDGPESGENDDGESESAEDRQTGGNRGVRSLSEYPTDEVFVNFSQYLYRMTGLLYPRDNEIEKDLALLHEHCGFSEEAALLMERLCHLSDTIRSAQTKNMSVTDVDRLVLEHFGREEEKEEPEPDGQSAEEKLARLSEQLSKRKEELKAEHEEHALTRKRAEKLEQENAELKAELNELRTMIRQDSGNEEQSGPDSAPSSPPVPLPYAASGRYVVFGGHDSWLKAIRPLLPNVRFINKKMRPDPNLIRNADVVWLQSNAIGHPDYYFITDLVRTAGIPIRYFSFASAEKCAEQLARFDMERGEASENRTEE